MAPPAQVDVSWLPPTVAVNGKGPQRAQKRGKNSKKGSGKAKGGAKGSAEELVDDDDETDVATASDDVPKSAAESPVDISELSVDADDEDALLEAAIAQANAIKAKRAALEAAVAAAKNAPAPEAKDATNTVGSSEDAARAAAMEAKRLEVEAAVAEAKKTEVAAAVTAALAAREAEKLEAADAASSSEGKKKATAKDLFGMDVRKVEEEAKCLARDEVKEFRMQGNYGATKFIKP